MFFSADAEFFIDIGAEKCQNYDMVEERKKIKLCYILPEYSKKTDSHFYHLYELISKAAKNLDIFLVVEKYTGSKSDLDIPDIKRIHIQKFRLPFLRVPENFLILFWARILGYRNFYTHYSYIGAFNSSIISRLSGAKSFYWNCATNWAIANQKFRSHFGITASVKMANFLITGTEGMKEGYAKYYNLSKDKIRVMPNWINLTRINADKNPSAKANLGTGQGTDKRGFRLQLGIKPEEMVILFVHWLSERKGAHYLMPIFKKLGENYKLKTINYRLLVVGDGPYRKKLEQEIRGNNLEDKIKLLGAIPNQDILKYFIMADVFLMPSCEEGFPRVLIEAMAAGLPYVASDIGGVREISPLSAQRFIVPVGDIDGYVEKIENLLYNNEIYEKFRDESLEWVKRYDIDRVVNMFRDLFKSEN